MTDHPYDHIHYMKKDLNNALVRAFTNHMKSLHMKSLDTASEVLPFDNQVEAVMEAFARIAVALLLHERLSYKDTMCYVHHMSESFVSRTIYSMGYVQGDQGTDFPRVPRSEGLSSNQP